MRPYDKEIKEAVAAHTIACRESSVRANNPTPEMELIPNEVYSKRIRTIEEELVRLYKMSKEKEPKTRMDYK